VALRRLASLWNPVERALADPDLAENLTIGLDADAEILVAEPERFADLNLISCCGHRSYLSGVDGRVNSPTGAYSSASVRDSRDGGSDTRSTDMHQYASVIVH